MDCPNHIRWRGSRQVVNTGGCLYVSLPREALREIDVIDVELLADGATLVGELTDDGELRLSLDVDDNDDGLETDIDAGCQAAVSQ